MFYLSTRFIRLSFALGLALALTWGLAAMLAQAHPLTTFMVTNTNNDGAGSLRQAILDANANPGADTIQFSLSGCPCVISLTTALPVITDSLTIAGPGADQLVVDANSSFRVFDIGAVNATLSHLTVQRGNTTGDGGGIRSLGALTLTGVNVLNNAAQNDGGGLYAGAALTVDRSTFTGNFAARGGGVYHHSGDGWLVNSLLARNIATAGGQALYLNLPSTVSVTHVTIVGVGEFPGTAISVNSTTANITDTIITFHTVGISNTAGTVSQDYNLFFGNQANTQGIVGGGAHSITANPSFITNYHLGIGSPAIDAGTNVGVFTDFDGDSRPGGEGFDIGYDEVALAIAYLPSPVTTAGVTTTFTATLTSSVAVTYTWNFGDSSALYSGNPVTHTYLAAGTYTVVVTATTSLGSLAASKPIVVLSSAPQHWLYLPQVMR